jgi:hypothetical protein
MQVRGGGIWLMRLFVLSSAFASSSSLEPVVILEWPEEVIFPPIPMLQVHILPLSISSLDRLQHTNLVGGCTPHSMSMDAKVRHLWPFRGIRHPQS